jgi:hypothetical protein
VAATPDFNPGSPCGISAKAYMAAFDLKLWKAFWDWKCIIATKCQLRINVNIFCNKLFSSTSRLLFLFSML